MKPHEQLPFKGLFLSLSKWGKPVTVYVLVKHVLYPEIKLYVYYEICFGQIS